MQTASLTPFFSPQHSHSSTNSLFGFSPEIQGPHEWHRYLRMESQCIPCRWPCSSRAGKAGSSSWGNERLQYTGTHLTNPEELASPYPRRGQSIKRNGGTGVKYPNTKVCIKQYSTLYQMWRPSLLKVKVLVAQSCPTLCDPVDCSPPDSSVHRIFQAKILEWRAISFSKRSSRPRDRTWVSGTAGRFFTIWATEEAKSP